MLDYQAVIKSDTATSLLNVSIFKYKIEFICWEVGLFMSRRNYFEILDLDFDPPESDERSIEKAIEKWEMNLQDMLANEANVSKRNILNTELELYSDIVNIMNDKKKRNTEARELKLYRVAQLEKLIDIMLVGRLGTPEVTNAMIRNVSLKLKLSTETVEGTYINKGFVIQKKVELIKLNDYFLTTVINDEINMLIKKFNSIVIPGYPWTSKVHDLFDLACFYSGGSDSDLTNFKHKRTKEIYNIMEAGAINFATEMSGRGHIFSDLFTKGTTQIFNSESNRKKYERSIEREKLKSFFAMLKSAPEEFKRDKYFAESCIKTIQKSFVDFNLSLALYNNEAGLTHEPYEPIEAVIHVTCPSCKASMEFGTSKEAENGKCAVCGTKLYVTCPKCDKKVPAFADWCSCGFHISEMKFFDEYYKAAELALKEMNLLEAQRQFANAQNAYPKNPKLITLNKLIKDETDKYEKPLNELKSLMESGKYCSAQKLIDTISTSMPQLNLDTQRKLINDKLSDAKKMMPHLSLPTSVRANRCVEILESVKDYQPAIDVLKTCPPNAPLNLHGTVKTGNGLVCSLTWNVSGDKGISYCVVRKKNGVPQRYSDGDVLSFDISTTEFNDKSIQPGISYGYSVFAYRQGVYSNPATYVVENFSDLDSKSVRAIADNGVCRFSWILPENCIGVRILKGFNSIPSYIPDSNCSVIAEQAITHFEDNAVENDKNYGYRLQCVYLYNNSFKYSQGYTLILKPEPPPTAVKNVTTKLEGRTVIVKWSNPDTKPRTVIIKEVSFEIVHDMIGQIIPVSDINSVMGNGKTYSNIVSTVQRCQFDIPQNTSLSLAIIVLSGTKGIISEVVRVSSVEKCEINKKETSVLYRSYLI